MTVKEQHMARIHSLNRSGATLIEVMVLISIVAIIAFIIAVIGAVVYGVIWAAGEYKEHEDAIWRDKADPAHVEKEVPSENAPIQIDQ